MKLIDRIICGSWFAAREEALNILPRHSFAELTKQAFAVDAQPVADWVYSAFGITRDALDRDEDIEGEEAARHKGQSVIGDSLLKLPFPLLWCEWKRPDGYECGSLLIDGGAERPHEAVFVDFLLAPGADRAELLGEGYFKTDKDFSLEEIVYPTDGLGWAAPEIKEATITFFHCKNVRIVARQRSSQATKRLKKAHGNSIHIPTFHVIEIHLTRTVTRGEASDDKNPNSKPVIAQIIRGHFKRYDGDSKLFGKKNGIWFWSMHVRGEGQPLKSEYRTWPPGKRHARRCIARPTQRGIDACDSST